jgi:type IV fimbrial biogenesis protein FimT
MEYHQTMLSKMHGYQYKRGALAAGFTLVELMVVIGIVAILASLAAPSFRGLLLSNTINSTATNLQEDLNFARSEALKRGLSVTACVSTSTIACANSGNWENGWIVFVDRDGDNVRDTASANQEDLIRVFQGTVSTFQIITTGANDVRAIRFERTGSSAARGLKLTPTDATAGIGRALCIATTGRVRLTKQGTETC